MFTQVDTRVPHEVELQVHSIYRRIFPKGDRAFVPRAFDWASQSFRGQYADYQAIDARYHDFEHTLQGTLCLARLLEGRHRAKAVPMLDLKMVELALLAILFHDTGYLKKRDDTEGTGAKYTLTHVARSAAFAREFLSKQGYGDNELNMIGNMISCTGVNADLRGIPFTTEVERIAGFALATADLLGQMAAPDYVDKLPILHSEFTEAVQHDGDKASRLRYSTADDLMRNTPAFWEEYVQPRINNEFCGLYKFLNDPYPDGPNPYIQRIKENLTRLRQKLNVPPTG